MSAVHRQRLACLTCTKKKIKCDKGLPCGNCVKRGQGDLCSRDAGQQAEDQDRGSLPASVSAALEASTATLPATADTQKTTLQLLENLLHRVESLEYSQRQQRHAPHRPTAFPDSPALVDSSNNNNALRQADWGSPGLDPTAMATGAVSGAAPGLEEPNQPTTLLPKDPCCDTGTRLPQNAGLMPPESSQLYSLQTLLPVQARVEQLVEYHIESLLWSHAAFHPPTFRRELTRFYDHHNGQLGSSDLDLQWIALLFAVLSGSIISASRRSAERWGFHSAQQTLLSERWYDAAIDCLQRAQYLSRHTLYSAQAIVTLTTSAYMLGKMAGHSVLMASAIRIAQSLGLHRLGAESDDGLSDGLIYRETGRRVWYTLVRQDYFFIPFSESYTVNPMHNNTDKPRNCRDEDMLPLPDSVPTVTSYCSFLDDIAALIPQLQDALQSCNTLSTQYEEILRFDAKMRALATVHRPIYFVNAPIDRTWPRYIEWARRSLTISSAHKIIMIHRKLLGRSFTDPVFSFTRETCVAASKTILKAVHQTDDVDRPILWIDQAFTVTACVILCFDMLYRPSAESETCRQNRTLVEGAIEDLCQLDQCIIARKGIRLLSALLREEQAGHSPLNSRKRKVHDPHCTNNVSSQPRYQPMDVETYTKGFWRRKRETDGPSPADSAPELLSSTSQQAHLAQIDGDSFATGFQRGSSTYPIVDDIFQAFYDADVVGWAANHGLYRPAAPGLLDQEPATGFETSRSEVEQIPSFEDLLFRAECFDF